MASKYCGKLPRCKNSWWCAVDYRPTNTVHCFEPITNADRIRAKSDKELAEFIWGVETDGRAYGCRGKAAWLKWLQQEATNES